MAPATTLGTTPRNFAARPLSKAPSSFEEAMKIEPTDEFKTSAERLPDLQRTLNTKQ